MTTEVLTIPQMRSKLWKRIHALRKKREQAFKKHAEHREKMYSLMSPLGRATSEGCPEAADIAGQIEPVIDIGKELGLIDKKVDYMDYI